MVRECLFFVIVRNKKIEPHFNSSVYFEIVLWERTSAVKFCWFFWNIWWNLFRKFSWLFFKNSRRIPKKILFTFWPNFDQFFLRKSWSFLLNFCSILDQFSTKNNSSIFANILLDICHYPLNILIIRIMKHDTSLCARVTWVAGPPSSPILKSINPLKKLNQNEFCLLIQKIVPT